MISSRLRSSLYDVRNQQQGGNIGLNLNGADGMPASLSAFAGDIADNETIRVFKR